MARRLSELMAGRAGSGDDLTSRNPKQNQIIFTQTENLFARIISTITKQPEFARAKQASALVREFPRRIRESKEDLFGSYDKVATKN